MSTQDAVKKAGLKATLPRMLILEVLAKTVDSEVHLSAEDIYKDLLTSGDDVGLATVYRVLSQFESAGIVTRHNFEEGHSVYEMRCRLVGSEMCIRDSYHNLNLLE